MYIFLNPVQHYLTVIQNCHLYFFDHCSEQLFNCFDIVIKTISLSSSVRHRCRGIVEQRFGSN